MTPKELIETFFTEEEVDGACRSIRGSMEEGHKPDLLDEFHEAFMKICAHIDGLSERGKKWETALEAARQHAGRENDALLAEIFPELKEEHASPKDRKEMLLSDIRRYIPAEKAEEHIEWIEKIGEQDGGKKFEEGDWVIDIQGICVYMVEECSDGYYKLKYETVSTWLPDRIAERNYRLWTIADAREGDVIRYDFRGDEMLALVKSSDGTKTEFYFLWDRDTDDTETFDGTSGPVSETDTMKNARLVTGNQRDNLMHRMESDGYVWNALEKTFGKSMKFKPGEWIISPEDRFVKKVEDVKDGTYLLLDADAESEEDVQVLLARDVDEHYRLWEINDAKKGDVLTGKSGRPFVFSGFIDDENGTWPLAYGWVGRKGNFISVHAKWTYLPVYPATVKEKELLRLKMSEAGYRLDEQSGTLKPAVEIIPEKFYRCVKDFYAGGKLQCFKGEVVKALQGMEIMGLGNDAWKYFEPVPDETQNEKFMKAADIMIAACPFSSYGNLSKRDVLDWLSKIAKK